MGMMVILERHLEERRHEKVGERKEALRADRAESSSETGGCYSRLRRSAAGAAAACGADVTDG